MERILKILIEKYPNSKFIIQEEEYFKNILFDNKDLKEDKEFYDLVYELAEEYLNDEEKFKFALVYDYLNQIETETAGKGLHIRPSATRQDLNLVEHRVNSIKETRFIAEYNFDPKFFNTCIGEELLEPFITNKQFSN